MATGKDYAGQHRKNQDAAKGNGRGKTARKSGGKAHAGALSLWAWMAIAISAILLAAVIYTISRPAGPLHLSPSSESAHSGKNKSAPGSKVVIPPREKPAYDFYTMLPNEQVGGARPNEALGEARPPPTTPATAPVSEASLSELSANQAFQQAAEISGTAAAPAAPSSLVTAKSAKAGSAAPTRQLASLAEPKSAIERKPAPAIKPPPVRPKTEAASPAQPARLAHATASPGSAIAPAGQGHFVIQIAAYRKREDAEHQRASLALNGLNAHIEAGDVKGQAWYRVRMGPFNNRDVALSAQTRLSASGFKAVLLPPEP